MTLKFESYVSMIVCDYVDYGLDIKAYSIELSNSIGGNRNVQVL